MSEIDENTRPSATGVDVRDGMLVVGLALIATGCWFVYPPAAAIVPGVILAGVAVFGVR